MVPCDQVPTSLPLNLRSPAAFQIISSTHPVPTTPSASYPASSSLPSGLPWRADLLCRHCQPQPQPQHFPPAAKESLQGTPCSKRPCFAPGSLRPSLPSDPPHTRTGKGSGRRPLCSIKDRPGAGLAGTPPHSMLRSFTIGASIDV